MAPLRGQRIRRTSDSGGMPFSAVVLAEAGNVGEQEVDRDAPGDRAQRQVVAAEPQRDAADDERYRRPSAPSDATRPSQGDTPAAVVSQAVV